MFFETFRQDVRIGARVLFKEPSFCLLAVGVLALGIAGVTTQFSLIDGILLRPLPFPESERLIDVQWHDPKQDTGNNASLSTSDYLELKEIQQSFAMFAGYLNGSTVNLTVDGTPERLQGAYVTHNFMSTLGAQPLPGGRDFTAEDDRPGAALVALIGHGLWKDKFAGDANVVGRSIRINGRAAQIVGVMPEGFGFPTREQIWLPHFPVFPPQPRGDPREFGLNIIARLKPGVSLDQAAAEWQGLARRFATMYPVTNEQFTTAVLDAPLDNLLGQQQRLILVIMLVAVIAVLLIACVNVMNMQLARAALRGRELAVRGALGATRARLVRQMLTESLLVALFGAALGTMLAKGFVALIVDALGRQSFPLPYWVHVSLDQRALVATIIVAVIAALLSGLVPALLASRANAADALKEGGRGNTSRSVNLLTRGLVISQIALTCTLLIVSLLIIRSVINRQQIDYGYDTGSILTARLGLFDAAFPTPQDRRVFFDRVLRELRAAPGVASAALTTRFRMTFGGTARYELDDGKYLTDADRPQASIENISGDYFATLGLRVLEGRDFTLDDADDVQPVALVNAAFARKHFPGQSAVGRRVRQHLPANPEAWRTIIGVVPDLQMQGPFNNPQQVGPEGIYVPLRSQPGLFTTILVRAAGGRVETLDPVLRRAVTGVDPDIPLYFVSTPKTYHHEVLAQNRLTATMFSAFGLVAVVLAAAGLYGVMAFGVNQRTQELGVRMALGADRTRILTMIFRQGGVQLAIGLAAGVFFAVPAVYLVEYLIGAFLFGVSPYHPTTYLVVIGLLTVVAFLACLVPALRASRVHPMVALRAE